MPVRTRVTASASPWALAQLSGPSRDTPVVHAGRHAIYVGTAGGCVGILAQSATLVPCGIRTMLPALPSVGTTVSIGEHRVIVDNLEVVVTRTSETHVPRLTAEPKELAVRLLRADAGRSRITCAELSDDALTLLSSGDPRAADALVGLGGGLTPLGDDVLCGWLATMHARHGHGSPLAARVAATAARSTTLLSATLLARAIVGDVIPEFITLLGALDRGDSDAEVGASADALSRVGHTSGSGLLLGTLIALTAPTTRSTP